MFLLPLQSAVLIIHLNKAVLKKKVCNLLHGEAINKNQIHKKRVFLLTVNTFTVEKTKQNKTD